MKNNEYKCAKCLGVFKKGRTDEEANEEAKELWDVDGANNDDRMEVICDDCFNEIHPNKYPELAAGGNILFN